MATLIIPCADLLSFLFYVLSIVVPTTVEAIIISLSSDENYISEVVLVNSVVLIGLALVAGMGLGYCLRRMCDVFDNDKKQLHYENRTMFCPLPGDSIGQLFKSIWSTYFLIPWFACNMIANWIHSSKISQPAKVCTYIPLITYFIGLCSGIAFYEHFKKAFENPVDAEEVGEKIQLV